jgi:hypothetical protein
MMLCAVDDVEVRGVETEASSLDETEGWRPSSGGDGISSDLKDLAPFDEASPNGLEPLLSEL